ncbi:hypothetical protein GB864_05520 [Agromyces sp. MMS17-SY077]|uniref:Cardiolipin synthase N-terminal domain-containing protein n=2 Tax=Agromyces seonyuensis TaxID=2662446 RepID=A0A6I4NUE4_9MICO|nr:SHOCT domain-containing protein [Agromyces seonyuensis]MWB98008.1 hypothetical protein [Agromyces seonyuensis]
MIWIFIEIAYLFAIIWIIIDVFRDHSLGGWGKAGWLLFLIVVPVIAGLVYLIARGQGMAERSQSRRSAVYEDDDYRPRPAANPTEEIAKAQELLSSGVITQGEFEAIKSKALTGRY